MWDTPHSFQLVLVLDPHLNAFRTFHNSQPIGLLHFVGPPVKAPLAGREIIIVDERTSHTPNIRALEHVWNLEIYFFLEVDLPLEITCKDSKLVKSSRSFEMNWQQTCKRSSFDVAWVRGTVGASRELSTNRIAPFCWIPV